MGRRIAAVLALVSVTAAPTPFLLLADRYAYVDGLGAWYIVLALLGVYAISSSILTGVQPRRAAVVRKAGDHRVGELSAGGSQRSRNPRNDLPLFPVNPPLVTSTHCQIHNDARSDDLRGRLNKTPVPYRGQRQGLKDGRFRRHR